MTISVPSLHELIDPRRAALLLIDIQAHVMLDKAYVKGVPEALAALKALVDEARRIGMTIMHIRVVERPETDTPVWVSRHVTKPHRVGARRDGTPGAEFHPDFLPLPGEPTMVKSRYSAFFRTNLDVLLRERGITSLLLTGIASNVCVEATAVDAFQREYWTVVVGDCTAARSPEEQERAMLDVQNNWGIVVSSKDVIGAWRASDVVAAAR